MKLDARLLRLVKLGRNALALSVSAGAAAGVLAVLQAALLSKVLSQVFLESRTLPGVSQLLLGLLLVILLRAASLFIMEVAGQSAAIRIKADLRGKLFRQLFALGPAYTRGERTGELAHTVMEGVEALDAYFSQYLPQLALAALVPLFTLAFVFPLDLISGLVLLLTAPLIPLFMILIGSLADAVTKEQWGTLSRMSAYFLDAIQGLGALKILGRSREQVVKVAAVSQRFEEATLEVLRVAFLSALVLELITTISTALVAVQVGLRLLYAPLTSQAFSINFEQAFFILVLAPEFYLPLRMLGTRFHAGIAGVTAASRIFEILEAEPEAGGQTGTVPGERFAPPSVENDLNVRFEKVSYTYPGGQAALVDLSFVLPAGEVTALIGPSGAGKSTVVQLLLGFRQPSQGQIRINDISLEKMPKELWRSMVSWVPQNPYLFNDTVEANLRLGCPNCSDEELRGAARLAHADEFIRRLPDGYQTRIGERGTRLSGGQAQRIALARAFLKQASLVIFDEPTANLDPETEALVQDSLLRLAQGRTLLIIAHRLNTLKIADQVILLEDGILRSQKIQEKRTSTVRYPGSGSREAPDHLSPQLYPHEANKDKSGYSLTWFDFLNLLSFILRHWQPVVLSVLLGFATVAAGVGLMSAAAYIIAAAALHPSIAELQMAIVGVRFFGLSRGIFRYLERYVSHKVTFRVLRDLRVWFYRKLEPLAPARLLQYHSGDIFSRIMVDISSLENFYVRSVAPPLVAGLVVFAAGLFLASFHFSLGLNLLFFLVLGGVAIPTLIRWLSRSSGSKLVAQRAELHTILVDGVQGMPDLLTFNSEERQIAQARRTERSLGHAQARTSWAGGLQTALMSLLAGLGMWVALYLAIPLVSDGIIPGVALPVIALATLTSFEAVNPLPAAAHVLDQNLSAARRLFNLVRAVPEVRDPPKPLPVPRQFDLQVNELSFVYPAESTRANLCYALREVTFCLPPGKRIAIVGPSGAGKTTLVNLLLRFWELGRDRGEILLNRNPLQAYDSEDWRGKIGVVSQNTYLFSATIRENLVLARPGASEEDLRRAIHQARLEHVIEAMPEGYDTWVGEQGLRLSGGERQRLAIALALLKDPPLLILDEPTANLDQETEREVLEAIDQLMEGRSTLLVTHRLVSMERMDEILVLENGRVVERGHHDELLANNGLYRRMVELQRGAVTNR